MVKPTDVVISVVDRGFETVAADVGVEDSAGPGSVQFQVLVDGAVKAKATVVSMSWGATEFSGARNYDSHFNKSGVTFVASSGDGGEGRGTYQVEWPAASPNVVAVGGTRLNFSSSGKYLSEVSWSGSGGGISAYETEPNYQLNYDILRSKGRRAIPDRP